MFRLTAVVLFALVVVSCAQLCDVDQFSLEATDSLMEQIMPLKYEQFLECRRIGKCPTSIASTGPSKCVDGMADGYPCDRVDLLSFTSLKDLGSAGDGNDIWGWTDPETGHEIAIMCCEDGTSFVDITTPEAPVVLGFLPTHTVSSIWRDAKVYKDHAFIVSEAPEHGMQVFDMTQLRQLDGAKIAKLEETAFYGLFGSSHNIVINEETGFAYSVGTKTCKGGLHIVDISDPANPVCAGCYWEDGYVHDAQCVIYNGPDSQYVGKEICFCYNEDTLTLVDVTDKANMVQLSRVPYEGSQYTHQGWLDVSQSVLFLNDELDEQAGTTGGPDKGRNTRTMIWDIRSLDNPAPISTFYSNLTVIDHNLYVNGSFVYEANYCGGLRILQYHTFPKPHLTEWGYFDVAPDCDKPIFQGSWSTYPYFGSGNVIVSSIELGLFVVRPNFRPWHNTGGR